jgi:ATP-dependent Zn protease
MTARTVAHTATHEAGHVVMSFLLGYDIEYVSIVPGDGYRGICQSTDDIIKYLVDHPNEPNPFEYPEECQAFWERQATIEARRDARIKEEIMVLMAGKLAEEVHFGSAGPKSSWASDWEKAVVLAADLSGDIQAVEELLAKLEKSARRRLSGARSRRAVEQLASDLLARRMLTGAEARAVVQRERDQRAR